jgi:hypothetical protein
MTLAEENTKKSKDMRGMSDNSVKENDVQSSEGDNLQSEVQKIQQISTENMEMQPLRSVIIYERKPFVRYNEIVRLGDEPFTFHTLTDRQIYIHILLAENEGRIRQRAELKYQKWWRKRGKELPREAQEAYHSFWLDRAYIEALSRYVCDAFGFTGDKRLVVLRFMMHLYQRLKKESVSLWTVIAEEELKIWEKKPNTDPKALRAAAHIVLKFMSAKSNIRG